MGSCTSPALLALDLCLPPRHSCIRRDRRSAQLPKNVSNGRKTPIFSPAYGSCFYLHTHKPYALFGDAQHWQRVKNLPLQAVLSHNHGNNHNGDDGNNLHDGDRDDGLSRNGHHEEHQHTHAHIHGHGHGDHIDSDGNDDRDDGLSINGHLEEPHHTHGHVHRHGHGHGHDGHSHSHGHGHRHASESLEGLNMVQVMIVRAAAFVGLTGLADTLRDNFRLCCTSMALILMAAVCPFALPQAVGPSVQTWLVGAAFPLVGVPALLDALVDVAGLRINIHVLMALGAFASLLMGNALEGGLLLAMFSLSHIAEDYFTERALGDVKSLKENYPEFAVVVDVSDPSTPPPLSSMTHKRIPVHDVKAGLYVLVRAGEAVPVDGEVWHGRSMVTVEHLTGEAEPIEKQVGDTIPGGARNLDGILVVKASKTWQESTIAKIMKLTEEARLNRPKLQRWLDEFGERYSQAVVAVSLSVAFLGPLLFKWPIVSTAGTRGSIYRALGVMVAASPCALAVAPLAYATAISSCASKGILLKGGQCLDALAACNTVAFDKTGTLTSGDLVCKAIEPIHGHISNARSNVEAEICCSPNCEIEALAVAAAMEQGATHPIARAVVDHSEGKKLPFVAIENFEALPGKGLEAVVSGLESEDGRSHRAVLGSLEYVASSSTNSDMEYQRIKEAASTSSYGSELVQAALSVNDKVTLFHFEDKLRPGALDVIASLKENGLRVLMLTGDRASSAMKIAKVVGITEVYSGLKPEDKLNKVKNLSRNGKGSSRGLIMVGDGINDAPALAAATVGIVLAEHASATAVSVADVLLLQDNIDGVPFVIAKARQTTALVKQSVALALACIIMAAFPSAMGFLPLWLTVLLHEGGTLLVCLNSARAFNNPQKSTDSAKHFSKGLLDLCSDIRNWVLKKSIVRHKIQPAGS